MNYGVMIDAIEPPEFMINAGQGAAHRSGGGAVREGSSDPTRGETSGKQRLRRLGRVAAQRGPPMTTVPRTIGRCMAPPIDAATR